MQKLWEIQYLFPQESESPLDNSGDLENIDHMPLILSVHMTKKELLDMETMVRKSIKDEVA